MEKERGSKLENKYDVIIIGAGPGGIFCAYELMDKNRNLKVLMVEKGRSIEKGNARNVPRSSVWAVSPVPLPLVLREQGHFLTGSFPYPRMWAGICHLSLGMTRRSN